MGLAGLSDFSFLDSGLSEYSVNSVSALDPPVDLQAVATLPSYEGLTEEEKEAVLPCDVAQGPSLYSEISYLVSDAQGERKISYYGNKLPRVTSSVVNPVAIIQGNIYASKVFTPTVAHRLRQWGMSRLILSEIL